MHYPPMHTDHSEHLRQLSVSASRNHQRRERAREDAAARKQRQRQTRPAPHGCEPTTSPVPAS